MIKGLILVLLSAPVVAMNCTMCLRKFAEVKNCYENVKDIPLQWKNKDEARNLNRFSDRAKILMDSQSDLMKCREEERQTKSNCTGVMGPKKMSAFEKEIKVKMEPKQRNVTMAIKELMGLVEDSKCIEEETQAKESENIELENKIGSKRESETPKEENNYPEFGEEPQSFKNLPTRGEESSSADQKQEPIPEDYETEPVLVQLEEVTTSITPNQDGNPDLKKGSEDANSFAPDEKANYKNSGDEILDIKENAPDTANYQINSNKIEN